MLTVHHSSHGQKRKKQLSALILKKYTCNIVLCIHVYCICTCEIVEYLKDVAKEFKKCKEDGSKRLDLSKSQVGINF